MLECYITICASANKFASTPKMTRKLPLTAMGVDLLLETEGGWQTLGSICGKHHRTVPCRHGCRDLVGIWICRLYVPYDTV